MRPRARGSSRRPRRHPMPANGCGGPRARPTSGPPGLVKPPSASTPPWPIAPTGSLMRRPLGVPDREEERRPLLGSARDDPLERPRLGVEDAADRCPAGRAWGGRRSARCARPSGRDRSARQPGARSERRSPRTARPGPRGRRAGAPKSSTLAPRLRPMTRSATSPTISPRSSAAESRSAAPPTGTIVTPSSPRTRSNQARASGSATRSIGAVSAATRDAGRVEGGQVDRAEVHGQLDATHAARPWTFEGPGRGLRIERRDALAQLVGVVARCERGLDVGDHPVAERGAHERIHPPAVTGWRPAPRDSPGRARRASRRPARGWRARGLAARASPRRRAPRPGRRHRRPARRGAAAPIARPRSSRRKASRRHGRDGLPDVAVMPAR